MARSKERTANSPAKLESNRTTDWTYVGTIPSRAATSIRGAPTRASP